MCNAIVSHVCDAIVATLNERSLGIYTTQATRPLGKRMHWVVCTNDRLTTNHRSSIRTSAPSAVFRNCLRRVSLAWGSLAPQTSCCLRAPSARQRPNRQAACGGSAMPGQAGADTLLADVEPVVLGQFRCPVARTDFVTRVGVSDPEAKSAHAIASGGGDVVVSDHLVRRHDGRDAVWIVEAQRSHVEGSMTRRAAAGRPASRHAEALSLPCRRRLVAGTPAVRSRQRRRDEPSKRRRRYRDEATPPIPPYGIAGDRDPCGSARDPTRFSRDTRQDHGALPSGPRPRPSSRCRMLVSYLFPRTGGNGEMTLAPQSCSSRPPGLSVLGLIGYPALLLVAVLDMLDAVDTVARRRS
jgi:hypothetical protein